MVASWPAEAWPRFAVAHGEKGPRGPSQSRASGGRRGRAGLTVPEGRRLLVVALPPPASSPGPRLVWSWWGRAKRQHTRCRHDRRRALHGGHDHAGITTTAVVGSATVRAGSSPGLRGWGVSRSGGGHGRLTPHDLIGMILPCGQCPACETPLLNSPHQCSCEDSPDPYPIESLGTPRHMCRAASTGYTQADG